MRRLPLAVVALGFAIAAHTSAEDSFIPVSLGATPPAVQQTITAQVAYGRMGQIAQATNDNETVFEVGLTGVDGVERNFTVADDGTLLSTEVALTETPAAVQKAIQAQTNDWELESVDKNLDDSELSYDVELSKGDREKSFTVAEDGTLISMEVIPDEAPDAVRKTIQARLSGGTLERVDKMFDDDVTYDIEMTGKDGSRKSFTVTSDGALASIEVTLAEVSPAARKTIKEKIGPGRVLRIDKALLKDERGVLPYEVQGRKDGKPFDFNVGPRGKFLGMTD